jgi:hypothetical protein
VIPRCAAPESRTSHEIFGRVTSLFLGHSPKSVKDRHYSALPQGLLEDALNWLHEKIFWKKK